MKRVIILLFAFCLLLTACAQPKNPSGSTQSNVSDNQSTVSSDESKIDETTSSDESKVDETVSSDDSSTDATVSTDNTTNNNSQADTNDDDEPQYEIQEGGISGTVFEGQPEKEIEDYVTNVVTSDVGGADKEAEALKNSIIDAKDAPVNVTGTTYYISPNGDDFNSGTSPEDAWGSLDALLLNEWMFEEGDAILFERGGVYRQNSSIIAKKSGIYYGAYGEGPKPAIYGSPKDYADETLWQPSNKENIWKIQYPLTNAGIIVFDYGKWSGERKIGLASLAKNGDFYHNVEETTLYLYCDSGNPGKVYQNIEIGSNQHIFVVYGGRHDITIDNICFKYTGAHGISLYEDNYNITITNCEIGWIGGSVHKDVTRYGNAIQFWDSCWNVNVQNNWIYQAYDAGFTFQYSTGDGGQYKDIVFKNNLVEYCTYSVEIFTRGDEKYLKNIDISDNIMRFAGYGWGNQRPNRVNEAHICLWRGNDYLDADGKDINSNFTIKNNIFDVSSSQVVFLDGETNHPGIIVSGNTYYQKAYPINNPAMYFGVAGKVYATNQTEWAIAVSGFDTAPKLVKWLS